MKLCKIEGCDLAHKGHGLCQGHLKRLKLYGDPLLGEKRFKGEAYKYLIDVLNKEHNDECLIWPYKLDNKGYGQLNHEKKRISVHQFACEYVNGPMPTNMFLTRHLCGNGHLGCFNPKHLVWGTYSENTIDYIRDGSSKTQGKVKLSHEQVLDIYNRSWLGENRNLLAEEYLISRETVTGIKHGHSWNWLTRHDRGGD